MVDNGPEDMAASPDPGRAQRAPPTIDLTASVVSDDSSAGEGETTKAARSFRWPAAATFSSALIAGASAAVAAVLVIAAAWLSGWARHPRRLLCRRTPAPRSKA